MNNSVNILSSRPRIGITIGDAAGIGVEVVLKAVADAEIQKACVPIIIGDARFLRETALRLNLFADYEVIKNGENVPRESKFPLIYDLANINESVTMGIESAATGKAAAEYIEKAVELCYKQNQIEAISTAPISKNALSMAGYKFPGHTEFLAHLTDTKEFAMSFFSGNLRVVLLSTHVSVRDALDLIKRDAVSNLIRLTNREMKRLGFERPKIAVAALNPHGGENQMFGNEEFEEINPAIEDCRSDGIDVSGAISADTLFRRVGRGVFDVAIALYHDQAT
ncbi:MAG: 4-hydroxythreonine-4-phosphate dehydrogenase PdxA, partial [Pyrinomonadaceae bacterium]|nr:4-hydroxythreonine-4-phosphate dehydrogenase PdxA [Pyrinomonadaceae bacterium]